MNCPLCQDPLVSKPYENITTLACPRGEGMWLTPQELDRLEDSVFERDEVKGSLALTFRPSERLCPQCGQGLKKFNYRFYDLELELCEQGHGFWLDQGEEIRVLECMKDDVMREARAMDVQKNWGKYLSHLQSKTLWSKLRDWLRNQ